MEVQIISKSSHPRDISVCDEDGNRIERISSMCITALPDGVITAEITIEPTGLNLKADAVVHFPFIGKLSLVMLKELRNEVTKEINARGLI
jgi:hypothetical protein